MIADCVIVIVIIICVCMKNPFSIQKYYTATGNNSYFFVITALISITYLSHHDHFILNDNIYF